MVDVSLDTQQNLPHVAHPISLKKIAIVGSIGTGIQFGWALQFSLLTPYLQLLGIPHKWTSFIWLCGPISGLIVQPIVGYQSDKCSSRWGRRRPFIAGGCFFVLVAIVLISFAVDFGRSLGDPLSSKVKLKAIAVFVAGFWIFDVANNTLQGPVRAFLADLAGNDQRRTRNVFAMYSFFLAVGSVLGYAAGSFGNLYKFLPFTKTLACDTDCANLKTCFFISIFLLLTFTVFALIFVQDKPVARRSSGLTTEEEVEMVESTAGASDTKTKELAELAGNPNGNSTVNKEEKIIPLKSKGEVLKALQAIPRPIWIIVFVTILNWMALCPFVLYDTDWMGKEVYGGTVGEGTRYASGVRAGALGLVLNSVVFGCTSLGIEFLIRNLGGVKRLWGCANFFLALCLGCTVLITKLAESSRNGSGNEKHAPSLGIRLSALALFAALGVPLGVAYSIPFALASIFTNSSGGGQGLTVGVLNLGIVIPQLIVSLTSGPWDELFGGGNLPSFIVGIFFAAASGIVVLTLLPSPPRELPMSSPKKTGSS